MVLSIVTHTAQEHFINDQVYAIGITNQIDLYELNTIASSSFLYSVFQILQQITH